MPSGHGSYPISLAISLSASISSSDTMSLSPATPIPPPPAHNFHARNTWRVPLSRMDSYNRMTGRKKIQCHPNPSWTVGHTERIFPMGAAILTYRLWVQQSPPYACCIAVIQTYRLWVHNTLCICIVLLLPTMHICVSSRLNTNVRVLVQGWGGCRVGLVHAPRPKGARVREIIIAACMTVWI